MASKLESSNLTKKSTPCGLRVPQTRLSKSAGNSPLSSPALSRQKVVNKDNDQGKNVYKGKKDLNDSVFIGGYNRSYSERNINFRKKQ